MEQTRTNSSGSQCCDGGSVVEVRRTQTFEYSYGDRVTMLHAEIPVMRCQECGDEWFDERGERAREEAVARFLGVPSAERIRNLRASLRLTRNDFALLGGFGVASLARWEAGDLIPHVANGRLLNLMHDPEVCERLKQMVQWPRETSLAVAPATRRFQVSRRSWARSHEFALRLPGKRARGCM